MMATNKSAAVGTLQRLSSWLSAQNQQQRAVTLGVLLGVIALLWYWLFFGPCYEAIHEQNTQIVSVQSQIDSMNKRTLAMLNMANDPANLQIRISLQQQLDQVDKQLEQYKRQLILPSQMIGALKTIITNDSTLVLKRMENLPPVAMKNFPVSVQNATPNTPNAAQNSNPDSSPSQNNNESEIILYKHEFVIQFEGDYFSTFDYMQKLEKLPWRLYWASVSYNVQKYPRADITFRVYTISTQRDLLDV